MTRNQARVLVVVPCYNEEAVIAAVVSDIYQVKAHHQLRLDVLVVNDCSTDRSIDIIRTLPCLYLDLPVNLGIGGAMHAGYKYAWRNGYDIAVQMDGDGQHPANQLMTILTPILDNQADVVIGSRFIEKEGFQSSAMRRVGINYFRRLNQALIGQTIYDSTSGFRAFNRRTLEIVNRYYPDEYPEPEAIVLFGLSKLHIQEVPVIMRERQGGVSSINSSKALYYMLKVSLGILFVYARLVRKNLTH
ncbi:glycosyltransferase family 2 protein [Fibrisoma montanum]|uniref:Glycosyltransferase family 2 protein n=1 Tax=Fibrisoma montanum TaxID=2305895 RepID=A0A418M818_9BACT|nr:glycosyltransferase family 2 protein [Fibrisoma montanum]RIV22287.1 glycosyltransferase family 2 protein [Fibrisoma montanum]